MKGHLHFMTVIWQKGMPANYRGQCVCIRWLVQGRKPTDREVEFLINYGYEALDKNQAKVIELDVTRVDEE